MLKLLRKKGLAKKLLWAIAITIILSFTLWGTGNVPRSKNNKYTHAGKIFGRKISFDDYEHAYRAVLMQAMLRYGDQFNQIRDYLDLESETWDRLLLLEAAKRQKIKVSDQELVTHIASLPYFQKNGRFDEQLYDLILQRAFQVSSRVFEEYTRENQKIIKLYNAETAPFVITDKDALDAFREKNEKTQVTYIFLPFEKFKDQAQIDPSQAAEFYEANKTGFTRPASVDLDYVVFEKPAIMSSDKKDGENTGLTPEQQTANEEVRNNAQKFYDAVTAGGEFGQTAAQNKLTIKSTGVFNMDKPNLSLGWPYEILYAVFQVNTGDILPVFESEDAFVVAQLREKHDPAVPPLNEVKNEVLDQMKLIAAKSLTKAKATELASAIREKIKAKGTFGAIAKESGYDMAQTPLFSRGEYLPQIGISSEFQEAAFALNGASPLSDAVQTQKGYAILHHENYEDVDMKAFEAAKNELRDQLLANKHGEVFNNYLSRLRIEARLEDNISKMKTEQQ